MTPSAWRTATAYLILSIAVTLAIPAGVRAAEPAKVWETAGFDNPESVLWDASRKVFYVSNVNGPATMGDGNGYISLVGPDGGMIGRFWVAGLDAPKGMGLRDNRLYVADINQLVVIDVEAATVVSRHRAPEARFLNDVTVDKLGHVYVSDMMDDAIYRFNVGALSLWLKGPALASPNGLLAEAERLVVASWGQRSEGFKTTTAGRLLAVSLTDKTVKALPPDQPVGNLDGLAPDGRGGYLVTDWQEGRLLRFTPNDGGVETVMSVPVSSADLAFVEGERLAVIPMMQLGTVVAYRLP